MGLFYLNLNYLTPVVLKRYGIAPFLIAIATAVIVVTFVNDWMHVAGPPPGDFRREPPPRPPGGFGGPLLSSFLVTAMIASVSSTIAFWNDWNKTREQEQERVIQKVSSELAVLKLQISPHFLFNTLNNIRWLIRSNTQKADEAVVKLSQLLRYILYQTNDEKVLLGKEIENVGNLITLQKMRLADADLIDFNVKGDFSGKMITPLLFVPLVENFFKHGDLDHDAPSTISFVINENRLVFTTENKIRDTTPEARDDSGLGLDNVRRRLELHYPNRHLFNISQKDNYFKVEMELLL